MTDQLSEMVLEYARDLRRNSSGSDDYPWEYAKCTADYLEELVRRSQAEIGSSLTSKPVAWRCRSTDEPEWNYGPKPLWKRDLFRKEPGFEEQPLFTSSLTSNNSGTEK